MDLARVVRGTRLLSAMVVLAGCGGGHALSGFGSGDDSGVDGSLDTDSSSVFGGGNEGGGVVPTGPVTDFPAPVVDPSAPANAASLFGGPTQGAMFGGPCLVEPENDVVYPQNWLRPRFRWTSASGANLFELRLHVANQTQDLLVYTANTSWTMPKTMWDALRVHSPSEAMTISLRGGVLGGTALQGEERSARRSR